MTVTPAHDTGPAQQPDRLLVVDFDFFFPNPLDAGAADAQALRLFDWGRAETGLHRETLWPIRAAVFAEHGVALPRCEPTDGFWDRFTIDTPVLVVADSNAYAGPLAWHHGFDEVVVFDAHHDSGYRRSYVDYLTTGEFSCEDWTFPHHETGACVSVRYPQWRSNWAQLEPSTAIPVDRRTDDGGPVDGVFTTVFACRSGGWVPAWCDDQWQQFVDSFPGRAVTVDSNLRPRWTHTPTNWPPSPTTVLGPGGRNGLTVREAVRQSRLIHPDWDPATVVDWLLDEGYPLLDRYDRATAETMVAGWLAGRPQPGSARLPQVPPGGRLLPADEAVHLLVTGEHPGSPGGSVVLDAALVEAIRGGQVVACRLPDGRLAFTRPVEDTPS